MFLKFKQLNQTLVEECYELNNSADAQRPKLHSAAIAIQAWWRGILTRNKIRLYNSSALKIQAEYRKHSQMRKFHDFVANSLKKKREDYYNNQATKIQALFRGYLSRKNIHNFYARKRYLEMIKLQNEIVKEHLNKFKKSQDEEARVLKNHRDEEKIVNQARRTHYLLSTAQISGVYDPRVKNGRQRQPMEQMLRTVKPLGPLERKVKLPPLGQDARVLNATERQILANGQKIEQPQGPFKPTRMSVLERRFRPMNPSLRVSEPYETSIEDARAQLKFDDKIKRKTDKFIAGGMAPVEAHKQLLHTKSLYGHIDYGNKHFRAYEHELLTKDLEKMYGDDEPDNGDIGEGDDINFQGNVKPRFKAVVSPIPCFDKYMDDRVRGSKKQIKTDSF